MVLKKGGFVGRGLLSVAPKEILVANEEADEKGEKQLAKK